MQKPGIIGRLRGRRSGFRKKNNLANVPIPTSPIRVIDASVDGAVMTLEFDQHVKVSGLPKYSTDVEGAEPIGAQALTATTVAVTFSESVAAATVLTIPFEDRAVRNASGGFIMTSTFPLTAEAAAASEHDMGQRDADGDDHVRQAA